MSADEWSTRTAPEGATPPDEVWLPPDSALPGVEIVPGYNLVTRLGRGGFGEVWRAVAPGGVPVAVKLLRVDEPSAAVEARGLDFMKRILHPHLLTTFGVWHRGDLLIIGMELAD